MTPEELKAEYLDGDFKLKHEFETSDSDRSEVLARAETYSGWTIPNLFPDEHVTDADEMQGDYQSTGARAVNHLANKIMLALFQPSRPFFKMSLSKDQKEELTGDLSEAKIDEALSLTERDAMRELDKMNARTVLT